MSATQNFMYRDICSNDEQCHIIANMENNTINTYLKKHYKLRNNITWKKKKKTITCDSLNLESTGTI